GPANVWKLALTESDAARLLAVVVMVRSPQSSPAESMCGEAGVTVTVPRLGGLGLAPQLLGPGWQASSVTTWALGWLLTLPSALRDATKVTYWVPAPKVNWPLPAGRDADQPPAPLEVSCRVEDPGVAPLRAAKLAHALSARPLVVAWKLPGICVTPATGFAR